MDLYRLNAFDAAMICLILLGSAGYIVFVQFGSTPGWSGKNEAFIFQTGQQIHHLNLDHDQTLPILNGKMQIEVKAGQIRVANSDCPRQVCVRKGWIRIPGEIIICVPNHVLVELGVQTKSFLDAVVD